jgi:hypothetical protein
MMPVTNVDPIDVKAALTPLRDALSNDGYDLLVAVDASRIVLTIEARADACEDCLVQKEILMPMALSQISEFLDGVTLDDLTLVYPSSKTVGG